MDISLKQLIMKATDASDISHRELIQSLWSGYGEIVRLNLQGSPIKQAVLKHVSPPNEINHPRGWHSDTSHLRKLKSYQVEIHWYEQWSQYCDEACRVPRIFLTTPHGNGFVMLLEDLNTSGFSVRKENVEVSDIHLCLQWLANFHATFLGEKAEGLWKTGCYWHLETRQDELAAMQNKALQQAASDIDACLQSAHYQTFVHGDAKLANFCFADDGQSVAAVDFQYVGGGCGIKDVAYFLGSCLDDQQCENCIPDLLDVYFEYLRIAIGSRQQDIDIRALEVEWRNLFPIAWVDFYRFLDGWMPNHWKINDYTRRLSTHILASRDM